jgi:NAD(P)-dependent dehydrogenase (short-subunit alcohol dehydrogenase family)
MSQSLAQALAPHGVFFYVVAPGFVETDMADSLLRGPEGEGIRSQSPLGRVATPEEVARTAPRRCGRYDGREQRASVRSHRPRASLGAL